MKPILFNAEAVWAILEGRKTETRLKINRIYDPPYQKGDILYIRERHPSIHTSREEARIFLRVTDVRVERLQDIDDDGVVAEGLKIGEPFDELWNRTIKPEDRNQYSWDANPWVWVISFEKIISDEYETYIGGGNKEAK